MCLDLWRLQRFGPVELLDLFFASVTVAVEILQITVGDRLLDMARIVINYGGVTVASLVSSFVLL